MLPFVLVLIVVLFVMGFSNPLLWVAAGVLLYIVISSGRGALTRDPEYQQYRERRIRNARYEKRFRREHPHGGGGGGGGFR
ncbi:hypothetical protein [Streptomyces sp. NPDC050504]|uniref:hypothetical protein n=1 Tax=Streptomyces sp. NPDC050504 TaxID=3365618 RepID=UPI00378CB2CC